ncbi:MAG: DUF86 domain-containing protein [Planctomycetes bacterium]|nr:DUF86 domain-containing protein [Planctomycetota bacterium]
MVGKERLMVRLDFLKLQMQDYPRYQKVDWIEYSKNRFLRREIERWVEDTINCVIDIIKIILSSEKLPIPNTNKELLKALELVGDFEKGFGERISRWADIRNKLAHEYLDLKWEGVKDFLSSFNLLVEFEKSVSGKI